MKSEEEKLQEAVIKLEILGKQQKEFIGAVTHEFKTPLTSVRAYLDLLSMYPEDPVLLQKALPAIEEETRRLYDMVEKTLELSKLEHYTPQATLTPLKLSVLVEEVLRSLKGKMEKFGLTLSKEVEEVEILGDREALLIILMNLLDNAIKYNKPQGKIFIRVYAEKHLGILQLEDTGIGIPMDLSQRIFDPFYTVDKNRSRETGGVGLGLSLAKKYTELQGGTLTLLASSEEGTAFQLSFPLAPESDG
jgi:signal transduction histidine kinase